MKIWINPTALSGEKKELLHSGALYTLKRLSEQDIEFNTGHASLSKEQLRLMENEKITFSDFNEQDADATITMDKHNNAILLSAGDRRICTGCDWFDFCNSYLFPKRTAEIERKTGETAIRVSVNLDGTGKSDIQTGLNFFDHMLDQIARHGLLDLTIHCDGDLQVDEHHTIEDTAITLGQALHEALTTSGGGIQRYGFVLPMDEALATVAIDLSNRPFLKWNVPLKREYIGDFPTEMAEHFFYTLAMNVKATLHVDASGKNEHHVIESVFKGFAKAFRFAISRNERIKNILPSTKGLL
ncbi:MAG: imidazoleglycerol-phosphate dehydratase HisB [Balneolaceae bacterium]